MATLVKETGAVVADANSYANLADGDLYHEKHYYASTWTAASDANQEKALMMATRIIDECYQFNGFKSDAEDQLLQWPRTGARDPDRSEDSDLGAFFPDDEIPPILVDATCELARMLLAADRTTDPDGEGMKQLNIVGSIGITFDVPRNKRPIIPHLVQTMLSKLGTLIKSWEGVSKLVRA